MRLDLKLKEGVLSHIDNHHLYLKLLRLLVSPESILLLKGLFPQDLALQLLPNVKRNYVKLISTTNGSIKIKSN